jgi:sarcosine oxidase subunit beta
VIIEKDTGPGLQASGRNAGGVRQQGRRGALPLAMEAIRLWRDLSRELESELEYHRTGNLVLALDEEASANLEEEAAWEQAQGLLDVRMMSAAECHDMVPGLTDQVVAGKHCASDGAANPMLVTPAYARAAQRHGAVIRYGTTALELLMRGSSACGVRTDTGEIDAEFVVNAAGPWAQRFNAMAGCSTPISPGRSQLLITEKVPPRLSPFLTVVGTTYLRQAPAGNVIIGIGGVPNENYEQYVDFPSIREQVEGLVNVFPWLREVNLLRTFAGITEYTPDGEPYIGVAPGAANFFFAAGFHGQGFCVGPMAGKILAELIEGGESPVSLTPFEPDRFSNTESRGMEPADVRYPGEEPGLHRL